MRKMANILPEAIGREEVIRAGRAMRYLRQWPEVVGTLLSTKSVPERFEHGTVWVAVSGSEWAQELRMMKAPILAKLRNLCGEPDLFTDIRFGVRPIALPDQPKEDTLEERKQAHRERLEGLSVREIRERRFPENE